MKQIILFKPGTISPEGIAKLEQAGYVPIKATDPNAVVMLLPSSEHIKGDAIIQCLLKAISGNNSAHERGIFATEFLKQISKA